jgi:hypothetical protein
MTDYGLPGQRRVTDAADSWGEVHCRDSPSARRQPIQVPGTLDRVRRCHVRGSRQRVWFVFVNAEAIYRPHW